MWIISIFYALDLLILIVPYQLFFFPVCPELKKLWLKIWKILGWTKTKNILRYIPTKQPTNHIPKLPTNIFGDEIKVQFRGKFFTRF